MSYHLHKLPFCGRYIIPIYKIPLRCLLLRFLASRFYSYMVAIFPNQTKPETRVWEKALVWNPYCQSSHWLRYAINCIIITRMQTTDSDSVLLTQLARPLAEYLDTLTPGNAEVALAQSALAVACLLPATLPDNTDKAESTIAANHFKPLVIHNVFCTVQKFFSNAIRYTEPRENWTTAFYNNVVLVLFSLNSKAAK